MKKFLSMLLVFCLIVPQVRADDLEDAAIQYSFMRMNTSFALGQASDNLGGADSSFEDFCNEDPQPDEEYMFNAGSYLLSAGGNYTIANNSADFSGIDADLDSAYTSYAASASYEEAAYYHDVIMGLYSTASNQADYVSQFLDYMDADIDAAEAVMDSWHGN